MLKARSMLVGVITNPNARKNKGSLARKSHLEKLVGNLGVVCETPDVESIRPAVEAFQARGIRYWVCDGGDGTFHWLLNELRAVVGDKLLAEKQAPILVPTNGGTIDFVARKAGIVGKADQIVSNLIHALKNNRAPETLSLQTLEVAGTQENQASFAFKRLGFATALGGMGQRFFKHYYDHADGSKLAVVRIVLRAVLGAFGQFGKIRDLGVLSESVLAEADHILRATPAMVHAGDREFAYNQLHGLHAGAIDVHLGGVKVFKHATSNKNLHLVVGGMLPTQEAMYKWLWLLVGKPIPAHNWHEFGGNHLEIRAIPNQELLDPVIDGEQFFGFNHLCVQRGPEIQVAQVRRIR